MSQPTVRLSECVSCSGPNVRTFCEDPVCVACRRAEAGPADESPCLVCGGTTCAHLPVAAWIEEPEACCEHCGEAATCFWEGRGHYCDLCAGPAVSADTDTDAPSLTQTGWRCHACGVPVPQGHGCCEACVPF